MLIDSLSVGGAESHLRSLCIRLKAEGHNVRVMSAGGNIAQDLYARGIFQYRIPNIGKSDCETEIKHSLLTRLLVAKEIISNAAKEFCPDIIHAHTRRTALLAFPVCKKYKIPLVVTAHAHFDMRFPKNLISVWGDFTIAVSEDIKKDLVLNSRIPKNKVFVIFNGV